MYCSQSYNLSLVIECIWIVPSFLLASCSLTMYWEVICKLLVFLSGYFKKDLHWHKPSFCVFQWAHKFKELEIWLYASRPRCLIIYSTSGSVVPGKFVRPVFYTKNQINYPLRLKIEGYAFHLVAIIISTVSWQHLGISNSSSLIKVSEVTGI